MNKLLLAALLFAAASGAYAQKISELPAASTPDGTETSVVVQGGTTKRATVEALVGGSAANAFLRTPSSANLRSLLSDEAGDGAAYFVGGALGTPASATLTNATGLPVSTGLTGLGTGVATALGVDIGSAGAFITLGGALGTPSSGTLTNATGLPVATGISGLGTGVATALAVNVGSAGAFVTLGGAAGTPSSITLTNGTGLPVGGITGLGTGVATALGATTNATDGIVTPNGTATLTNKTLTAPVLGGTVTGTYTLGGTPSFPAGVTLDTEWDSAAKINAATTDDDFVTLTGAQSLSSGTKTVTAKFDFGGGTLEIPNSTTLPASCVVGEIYFDTNATLGQQLFACTSTNTWTLQGDGGGGGTVDVTGTPSANQLATWSDADTLQGITTGTGVVTALGVNVGSVGAFITLGGAAGTPSSITLTNGTGLPVGGISATGTPDGTTFLRGDGAWATPAGAGDVVMGTQTAGKACVRDATNANEIDCDATFADMPASTAQGDLLYLSAADTVARLAKDANATRYLSNTGTDNNPAWAQINLANGVTGDLPLANLAQASAESKLLGRGAGSGAGDYQEITIGSGLSMSGTTLSATGGGFDATTLDAVTWSDGANASNVWTFDVSGTDPTITFGDGAVTVGGTLTATAMVSSTPSANDNDTSVATTAYVQTELTAYASDTVTFTNKTFDASATGNALKLTREIQLTHPDLVDGTGCTIGTTSTAIGYGRPTCSNSADEASNYAEWYIQVPADIDTAVALTARIKFLLGNTDTGTHRYVLSSVSVADDAVPTASTLANAANCDFPGDATGANGDVFTATCTLTGWAAALTANDTWRIRLARDGDATEDGSTVNSTVLGVKIVYGVTQ